MRAILDPEISEDLTSAIPVSPIKIDLGALKAPPAGWWDRLRFPAILLLCLGLHAALVVLLEPRPDVAPVEEAIPVEVIVEPPPEDVAQEQAKPEIPDDKQAQTIDEKPATDFARTADQDREDGKAAEVSKPKSAEPEVSAPEQHADIEPLPPGPEPAPQSRPEPPPPPQAPPKPAPRFAGFDPLPDFEFQAPLAKRSDLPAGRAEPGYLSTLYGLIMRKMPQMPKQPRTARGRVTFGITSSGQVIQESIEITSGAPFLDAAALSAVRRAAPFPAPPKGGPVYIRFDYGSD